jgi:death on curing protein
MIKYLTVEQALRLHDAVVEQFGGLKGVRDINLLHSTIETPKTTMFGDDLYPTIHDKAAMYLFNIISFHPFNDGNKRTGAGLAYLFLKINKMPIGFEDQAYEDYVVKVANGKNKKEDVSHFLEWGYDLI